MRAMRYGWMGLLAAVCACVGAPSGGQGSTSGDDSSGSTNHPQPPADACAGLLPTLPAPRTFTITAAEQGGLNCSGATTDGAGNVYLLQYVQGVRNIAGGGAGGNFFQPLAAGFTSFRHGMSPATRYSAYTPDGREISGVDVSATDTLVGLQANGGTILVECGKAWKFDDRGAFTTVQLSDPECLNPASGVLVDQQERILIVRAVDAPVGGVPSGHYAAQWFDTDGRSLTGWFDAGAVPSTNGPWVTLRPLIGGGAVLRNGAGQWEAAFVSGTANVGPAPAFLPSNTDGVIVTDLAILRGGKAYAVVSWSYNPPVGASVAIFAPGGESCGTLATKTNRETVIGKDGTLIGQTGEIMANNDCVTTWYPQALK